MIFMEAKKSPEAGTPPLNKRIHYEALPLLKQWTAPTSFSKTPELCLVPELGLSLLEEADPVLPHKKPVNKEGRAADRNEPAMKPHM